eukprot:886561-Heterocapsa_arctica.AAC.1
MDYAAPKMGKTPQRITPPPRLRPRQSAPPSSAPEWAALSQPNLPTLPSRAKEVGARALRTAQ